MAENFKAAFGIGAREIISLVGAGGKTTLMYVLARELIQPGKVVITTTTTKIHAPQSTECRAIFISEDVDELVALVKKNASRQSHMTLAAAYQTGTRKLIGLSPEAISRLARLPFVDHIIIEADGAARRPLKAPQTWHEPVIVSGTTSVIALAGIDALGNALSEKNVFRAELVSKLTGLAPGAPVTETAMVQLMLDPKGLAANTPAGAKIIPFINKVDSAAAHAAARKIAGGILTAGHAQIDRVAWGQAHRRPPLVEVLHK